MALENYMHFYIGNRSRGTQVNKDIRDLNHIINKLDLTLHSTTTEYPIFFKLTWNGCKNDYV